jgi:serine/threonine protein kinase
MTNIEDFDYKKYIKEFKIVKKLGEGGFGEVYLGKHFISNEDIAIKRIVVSNRIPADEVEEVFKEAKNLQKLNHINIIKLKNVFMIERELFLMIEYFAGGDLHQYLKARNQVMSDDEARVILQ